VDRRRQSANGANGSDVEDASLPLPDHLFIDWFCDREKAAYVRIDDLVPGPIRGGREVIATIDGRVVNQDVNSLPPFD
jgi:hypothetical protein